MSVEYSVFRKIYRYLLNCGLFFFFLQREPTWSSKGSWPGCVIFCTYAFRIEGKNLSPWSAKILVTDLSFKRDVPTFGVTILQMFIEYGNARGIGILRGRWQLACTIWINCLESFWFLSPIVVIMADDLYTEPKASEEPYTRIKTLGRGAFGEAVLYRKTEVR